MVRAQEGELAAESLYRNVKAFLFLQVKQLFIPIFCFHVYFLVTEEQNNTLGYLDNLIFISNPNKSIEFLKIADISNINFWKNSFNNIKDSKNIILKDSLVKKIYQFSILGILTLDKIKGSIKNSKNKSISKFIHNWKIVFLILVVVPCVVLMFFIVIYIEEVDPEQVREILLNYIAETEHREPFSLKLLEKFGF